MIMLKLIYVYLNQSIGGYIMDYNSNDDSNLNNSNDYPNHNYDNNEINNFNNSQDDTNLNSNFNRNLNNEFNNNFNNNYNSNFNHRNFNEPNPRNGYAIASLILGIISIPFACCYGLGIITAIIGIIMGIVSRKYNNNKLSGMALAGIICSIFGIVFSIFSIIYYIIIFSSIDFSDPSSIMRQFKNNNNGYY